MIRLLQAQTGLQRKPDPAEPAARESGPMLVDGPQASLAPGQMTRERFLAELRQAVTSTADAALGPLWSAAGCPYIDRWFAEHAGSDAALLERLARRYSGVAAPTSASDLIAQICARLEGSIRRWREGGELEAEIADAGLSLAAPAGEDRAAQAKREPGAEAPAHGPDPLGHGAPLEASAASRFGDAFGADFHDVRVHHDAAGARSATSQGALAYTVGEHIAFAEGRYRPGTPVGDALLAHELAHVVQQRGGARGAGAARVDDDAAPELEADQAAVTAMLHLHGGAAASAAAGSLRLHTGTGLKLQRCKSKKDTSAPPATIHTMDATQLKAITDSPSTHSFGEVAAASARAMLLAQQAGVAATGQGPFMGSHNTPPAPTGVTKTDCTEYVVKVLGDTFRAQGKGADWNNIITSARAASGGNLKGTELLKAMQNQAGWTAVFWGADPRHPADADPTHPTAYKKVREDGTYYGINVDKDKSVIEYRPTNPATPAKTDQLEHLRRVPFGVIAARGGTHMTVLINGVVYEVHWDRLASDPNVIEATPLESWPWLTGVVLMPAADMAAAWKD